MKKLIAALAFGAMAFTGTAQIDLVKSFTGHSSGLGHFKTENQVKFYSVEASQSKVIIYNEDFSVYKSFNYTKPSGFNNFYLVALASQKTFNLDDKIEMCLVFSATGVNKHKMILINEEGQTIKDLGNAFSANVIETSNGLLLHTIGFNVSTSPMTYDYNFYSLPGVLLRVEGEQENFQYTQQSAFPNPSNTTINLPYQLTPGEQSVMEIYNLNGKLVERKNIGSHFNQIRLNVESYPSGIYIYTYKGISNKFVVK